LENFTPKNAMPYLPSYFFKIVFLVLKYKGHFFSYAMVIDALAKVQIDYTTPIKTKGIFSTYHL
jgi:hypothetical protein